MKIVIDPDVLRNAQGSNGYGKTLSHILNKAQYYCHVYTEELRATYARVSPTGQATSQLVAAELAKQLYLASNTGITIHRQIIAPFLSTEEACGDGFDCCLTESDKQLIRVAKSIVHESATALEAPKIIILVDCSADSRQRCLCQEGWTERLTSEVPGTHICHAADCDSVNRWLQREATFSDQQHQARLEEECARWLDRQYDCHGKLNYKYSKMVDGKIKEFEQDYFCDAPAYSLRQVRIGESKLLEGADQVQKLSEGIGQLERAVRYLAQDEPKPNSVDCFLFSNSSCLADHRIQQKAQLLATSHGVAFHLYRVTMPNRWKNQPNWLLENGDFEEVCSFPAEVAR